MTSQCSGCLSLENSCIRRMIHSIKDDPCLTQSSSLIIVYVSQSIDLIVVYVSVFQAGLLPGMGGPRSSNHVLGIWLLLYAVILHR